MSCAMASSTLLKQGLSNVDRLRSLKRSVRVEQQGLYWQGLARVGQQTLGKTGCLCFFYP